MYLIFKRLNILLLLASDKSFCLFSCLCWGGSLYIYNIFSLWVLNVHNTKSTWDNKPKIQNENKGKTKTSLLLPTHITLAFLIRTNSEIVMFSNLKGIKTRKLRLTTHTVHNSVAHLVGVKTQILGFLFPLGPRSVFTLLLYNNISIYKYISIYILLNRLLLYYDYISFLVFLNFFLEIKKCLIFFSPLLPYIRYILGDYILLVS